VDLPYYAGREATLAELFGASTVVVHHDAVEVDGRRLPVVDDVIVAVDEAKLPPRARSALGAGGPAGDASEFAEDIQFTFGEEWWAHGDVLPEHRREFEAYFDLVDLDGLADKRVAGVGCGSGRWASFVAPRCRELVVVDFSDAIFVARRNLRAHDNVVFSSATSSTCRWRPTASTSRTASACSTTCPSTPSTPADGSRRWLPSCSSTCTTRSTTGRCTTGGCSQP
jgi:hypothetical protein